MTETKQLSVPAVLALGAISFAPVLGAGIAIAQHSLDPFGYGAVAAVGLFLAYLVGTAVAQAREARRIALRAENEVHSGPVTASRDGGKTWEPVRAMTAERERDLLRGALAHLQAKPCWSCGAKRTDGTSAPTVNCSGFENRVVVRLGSESGKREPDVTDMTRSPDPDHPGA